MHLHGKITLWRDADGFGFISPKSGGGRVFVPIRSFSSRKRRLSFYHWLQQAVITAPVTYEDLANKRVNAYCAGESFEHS